jgi:hypothetical protein
LTLEGENDAVDLSFVVDKATLAGGGDLVIAYRNAVSVMPEASLLSVMINGCAGRRVCNPLAIGLDRSGPCDLAGTSSFRCQ